MSRAITVPDLKVCVVAAMKDHAEYISGVSTAPTYDEFRDIFHAYLEHYSGQHFGRIGSDQELSYWEREFFGKFLALIQGWFPKVAIPGYAEIGDPVDLNGASGEDLASEYSGVLVYWMKSLEDKQITVDEEMTEFFASQRENIWSENQKMAEAIITNRLQTTLTMLRASTSTGSLSLLADRNGDFSGLGQGMLDAGLADDNYSLGFFNSDTSFTLKPFYKGQPFPDSDCAAIFTELFGPAWEAVVNGASTASGSHPDPLSNLELLLTTWVNEDMRLIRKENSTVLGKLPNGGGVDILVVMSRNNPYRGVALIDGDRYRSARDLFRNNVEFMFLEGSIRVARKGRFSDPGELHVDGINNLAAREHLRNALNTKKRIKFV
ncbi:hypothetical protein [Streptomyces cinereoruber]|uniref:hypothetical protein n=1 Tax=Streptomyces cinereoruber TaxID=67260 RepID=UPI003656E87B